MMQFGHCPRCGDEITSDRVMGSTVICGCGWTMSRRAENAQKATTDRTIGTIILGAVFLVGSLLHILNWDKYALSVIPLKAKAFMGSASVPDYERLAEICAARKKFDCSVESYQAIGRLDPKNAINWERLGKLQYQLGNFEGAAQSLEEYNSLKGRETESLYFFAQSLKHLKRYDESDKIFRKTLHLKPKVLQVTVVRGYVQMLMDAGRFKDAKQTILYYRGLSTSANLFMDKELADIRWRLGEVTTTAANATGANAL